MRAIHLWLVWAAVALVVPAPRASARALPDWPYDKLFKEADLVVVAEAKGAEDCDDRPTDPGMKDDFQGRTSTLEVRGTLKGKAAGAEVNVLHFRLRDGVRIENGPCLVAFRTASVGVTLPRGGKVELSRPHYLLFLKQRKDGRYEPVSGEYDPALSVREMYIPSGAFAERE
jgi:hypothetical protein